MKIFSMQIHSFVLDGGFPYVMSGYLAKLLELYFQCWPGSEMHKEHLQGCLYFSLTNKKGAYISAISSYISLDIS